MMPEISRFLGIIILMYFNDHDPPHFHVQYNEFKAIIDIETLALLDGKLPGRVLGLVIEWAELWQEDLLSNWHSLRTDGSFRKITPLWCKEENMYWVTNAAHEGEYRVHIRFNDDVEGVVDLRETICHDHRAIFQELRDPKVFQTFRVDMDTIVWDNGLDLAPEFLRNLLLPKGGTSEILGRDAEKAVETAR